MPKGLKGVMDKFAHKIIIRYAGELAIKKSTNFQQFAARLRERINYALHKKGVGFALKQEFSRLSLLVDKKEESLAVLSKIFGIGSYSPIEVSVESNRKAILRAAEKMIPHIRGRRFAVRAKRTGGGELQTPEVERAVGALLAPYGKVDLGSPEKTVHIEMINRQTHLFCERIVGRGGLPLNPNNRCLSLISGGFDSAVASWQMMKRGVACDYLFCTMGGKSHERQTLQVVKVLNEIWSAGLKSRLFIVDFQPVIGILKEFIPDSYRQVVLKRVMYRVAEKVAIALKSKALVTGESLGQVTSQSLQNIKVIDEATSFVVLRPLIGLNKEEIIRLAYDIGTGLLSEKVVELCGISKGQPVTNAGLNRVLALEKNLPKELEESLYRGHRKIDLDSFNLTSLRGPYLFINHFDNNAKVIDCREEDERKPWIVPGALHLPLSEFARGRRSVLNKGEKYIIYCALGSKSPTMAEMMQQLGYEAYAFAGGVQKVRREYERQMIS